MSHEENIFISNLVNTQYAREEKENKNFRRQTSSHKFANDAHRASGALASFHRFNMQTYESN